MLTIIYTDEYISEHKKEQCKDIKTAVKILNLFKDEQASERLQAKSELAKIVLKALGE